MAWMKAWVPRRKSQGFGALGFRDIARRKSQGFGALIIRVSGYRQA